MIHVDISCFVRAALEIGHSGDNDTLPYDLDAGFVKERADDLAAAASDRRCTRRKRRPFFPIRAYFSSLLHGHLGCTTLPQMVFCSACLPVCHQCWLGTYVTGCTLSKRCVSRCGCRCRQCMAGMESAEMDGA